MYTPKTSVEILSALKGMVLSRTGLSDILPGSVLSTLLNAVAMEMGSAQRSLYNLREGFFLEGATGQELIERCRELPLGGVQPLTPAPASGAVLTINRDPDQLEGDLVIPAGSSVGSINGTTYTIPTSITMGNGVETLLGVYCVATTTGTSTNAGIGEIVNPLNMPAEILSVTNPIALSNGSDEESDDDLRARALVYLSGLSRSQRDALRYLALSFIGSQGERMRYASIYEDYSQAGYTEVVVDDGSGITATQVSRQGINVSGVIPSSGVYILYHESPAIAPITTSNLSIKRNGSPISINNNDIVSLHERGVVYLKSSAVQAGDTWTISDYRVFTGFVSELQKEIEGDPSAPTRLTGFRSAGTRVVVTPANPQFVRFDVQVQVELGYSYDQVADEVRTSLINYINSLAPNEPMFASSLIQQARRVSGTRDVAFFNRGTATPLQNTYPESPKSALRADSQSINLTPLVV